MAASQSSVRADGLPRYLPAASCGLSAREASRWHDDRRLNGAAALWARGAPLREALERSGYTASAVSGIHIENVDAPRQPALGASTCRSLRDASMRDIGRFGRGDDAWIVIAAPIALPAKGDERAVALRALELVNRARATERQCGTRTMPAAGPLRLSSQLAEAAVRHADDMAAHHYFEHEDRLGLTPADRVRATGYVEHRVGENIAYGTLSTDDAIAGWIKSPGHCENLMDANFQEMGIAFARESGEHAELYWVQVLAAPSSRRSSRFAPQSPNH